MKNVYFIPLQILQKICLFPGNNKNEVIGSVILVAIQIYQYFIPQIVF